MRTPRPSTRRGGRRRSPTSASFLNPRRNPMKRYSIVLLFSAALAASAGLAVLRAQQNSAANQVMVYKTSTCGCCGVWVEHLRSNGFQVKVEDLAPAKLRALTNEAGVTPDLAS